jgi:hypothetical protein
LAKHLIAFSQGQSVTSLTKVNFVADATVTPIGANLVQVPATNLLIGAYGYSAALTRYQISTPSLKSNRVPILVDQVDQTATQPAILTQPPLQFYGDTPIPLAPGESLEVDEITTGVTQATFGVWLDNGFNDLVTGPLLTGVRATSSTTLTAFNWTATTLTFDNTLPVGSYAVVGMVALSATGILARVAFPGYAWRMGVIAGANTTVNRPDYFRLGRFGTFGAGQYHSWGAFISTSPPQVEFLANAADTSETVLFDLVKLQ